MTKEDRPKKKAGRPAGTGAGYTKVFRVLLTEGAGKGLEQWKQRHAAQSMSDAIRRIVEQALKRDGLI